MPIRPDLVLRARRVLTPDGERPAALLVADGRIVAVQHFEADLPVGGPVLTYADDVVLLPGLVDTHVHLQDPGTDWEGFGSGTRAAAAGGVTTVGDMPVDASPATVDAAALAAKLAAARGRCHVDVGFWGGLTPRNPDRLPELAAGGVLGFKAFLTDPGAPDFPPLPLADLQSAAAAVAALDRPFLVHAEHPDVRPAGPGRAAAAGPVRRYLDHLAAHPVEREVAAVDAVVAAAAATGCRMHVVHVSTAQAADRIGRARVAGLPMSGETCPHLLCLTAEEVPDGAVEYSVGPPLRDRANADLLWWGLETGALDLVVSDHSPTGAVAPPDGDFATAPPGIAAVQLALPVVWTAARRRGVDLATVVGWMSAAPARLAGLRRKGALDVGKDADVVVLAPEATFDVDPDALYQRQTRTPYTGRTLYGVVRETWLRGRPVDGVVPRGRLLLRE